MDTDIAVFLVLMLWVAYISIDLVLSDRRLKALHAYAASRVFSVCDRQLPADFPRDRISPRNIRVLGAITGQWQGAEVLIFDYTQGTRQTFTYTVIAFRGHAPGDWTVLSAPRKELPVPQIDQLLESLGCNGPSPALS